MSELPSRTPEARHAEYVRNRVPRKCSQCSGDIPLGSKQRLCTACRATPNPRCKKCKKVKPLSRFSHDASRPSGFFPWCMDCQSEGDIAFQKSDAETNGHFCPMDDVPIRGHANRRFCSVGCKDRARALRTKFGLTPEQFRAMVDATQGRCPLCKRKVTQWHVDHNHKTQRVTGVVCSSCNIGPLAYSYHDVEFVRRLLDYLESTPAERLGIVALAPEGAHRPSKLHARWRFRQAALTMMEKMD